MRGRIDQHDPVFDGVPVGAHGSGPRTQTHRHERRRALGGQKQAHLLAPGLRDGELLHEQALAGVGHTGYLQNGIAGNAAQGLTHRTAVPPLRREKQFVQTLDTRRDAFQRRRGGGCMPQRYDRFDQRSSLARNSSGHKKKLPAVGQPVAPTLPRKNRFGTYVMAL